MERAQAGDREAYRELLDSIGPMLRAFLRRWVANAEDLDDLYQEVLMTLHRARHTYDPGLPLEPWLFAIARNTAADHHRRRTARARWEVLVDVTPETVAEAEHAPTARLDEILGNLPDGQREAFEMLKLEGLSVQAGAERAGVSPGTLKVRAHRAYKTIKALLRR